MFWRRLYKFFSIFAVVIFIIFIALFAFDRLLISSPNHPVAQAIKTKLKQPEQWRPYTSQRGKFRVLVPGGYPNTSSQSIQINGRPIILRSSQVNRRNPISYTVSYFDLLTQPVNSESLLQALIDAGAKTMKATKLSSQDINLGQVRGKENYLQTILQKGNLPATMRHRVYVKVRRVYQLVVVTPSPEKFKEESDKFMDSFEIIQ